MKKSLSFWQFAGFVFTGIMGTLLHFAYDWTNSRFIALFSAVNESIWEHMKLLFFPMLIFSFLESRIFKNEYENFWTAKLIGILLGLAVIPTVYYTYTGIFGINADWFNILIFFIAAAVAFLVETRVLKGNIAAVLPKWAVAAILILITVLFMFFTFLPPEIPLFKDPVTNTYGLA